MFEALKRDGLARTGIYSKDSGESIETPSAIDADSFFPDLKEHEFSNIPLFANKKFVDKNSPEYKELIFIHPESENKGVFGDCLILSNWHTVLENPKYYVKMLLKMKGNHPSDTAWYTPACALPSNVATLINSGFDIFDYRAVDLKSAKGIFCTSDGEFLAEEWFDKGLCRCSGCENKNLFEHNRNALDTEIETVKNFLKDGHLRELLERRCRNSASQVSILRLFDMSYDFIEPRVAIARSTRLYANSGESLKRPEVKRFVERVIERFVPSRTDTAVLIPCSAKKPYSSSQSHMKFQSAIQNRAHEIIITSPLGIVPRELERMYPAGHYDVPVTGYWDGEERAFITDAIARYFEKNRYEKVFVHLDGDSFEIAKAALERSNTDYECTATDKLTSSESLKKLESALKYGRKKGPNLIKGTLSYQFGFDADTSKLQLKGKFMREKVLMGKKQVFSIDTGTGLMRPTFEGWDLIESGYRVYIDNFIPQGDILAPGVLNCDPDIREGDEVFVVGEGAVATGRAAMGAAEMCSSKRGVAVRVRKVKKL
ncbi:archaeosine synthase subunit alpha [Methanomicrobium antiquum]|uniref:Archaeosine synthase subunit alpha n=1 Tax=Methanomicrobium antiquum TaxID=487686 RepID=A0AAF0FNR7_9EURY|nr:archaeosine synthase subunit alpha [Methanomicrobium antiquum]MDD3976720.1 archaeosine synthase subunit alpha [Methanomicrobium sp.]WFN35954.1 archaeosine synthase subunit alpha [Methanomicrobium antiquum]